MRWVTRNAAKGQLGIRAIQVPTLVRLKVLRSREQDGVMQVQLDAELDGPGLMEGFYDREGPCTTVEQFERMRSAAWHLLGKARAEPPKGLIADAFAFMTSEDQQPTVEWLRSLTGVTETLARRLVLDHVVASGGSVEDIRAHFHADPGDHYAAVVSRLPPELRDMPGTCLAPDGHPDDRPLDKHLARLASFHDEGLFCATAICVFRSSAKRTSASDLERRLAAMHRVDHCAGGNGMTDPFVVRERLETILGTRWAAEGQAEGKDFDAVNRYRLVHEDIDEYVRLAVPADRRSVFRRHQLVLPAGQVKFLGAVRAGVSRYQRACAASRQRRIEYILDEPLEFLLVGRTRLLEHQELRDACRRKIDEQIAKGGKLTKPIAFQYTYTTRLPNERFRRCEQTLHLELWTWDLVHEHMHAANKRLGIPRHSYGENAKVDNAGRAAFVVAYAGVTPKVPGGPVQTPLIAEVADSFILDEMPSLDDDQRRRRAAACARWEFPTRVPAMAGGLPTFPWSRRHTAREANKLLTHDKADGTTGRILLLAHEEFTHGLMYAHASVFISADAGCRTTEAMQAPSDPRSYETRPDDKTGDVFKEFDAIGKGGPPALPKLISPDTFRHVTDLILESAHRWHRGRAAPAVPPNHDFRKRGIKDTARRAFAVDDRMLNPSELATLHRVLYLGWHGLRGHDVRHVFNALGRRAGIPRDVRQRILHHTDPNTTDLYGPATPKETSKQQIILLQHLSGRMACIRDSEAGEASEAMRRADLEMRRAEMNVRFYQQHGMHDEAEGMKLELSRWADELAEATAHRTGGDEVVRACAI